MSECSTPEATTVASGSQTMNPGETTNEELQTTVPNPDAPGPPLEDSSSLMGNGVMPMIRKAVEKHHREWEELMKRYPYQWAAYRGDERLEIGKTKHGLCRKYLDRGLSRDELVVLGIGPPIEDEHDR
jgi:hypothetical protein